MDSVRCYIRNFTDKTCPRNDLTLSIFINFVEVIATKRTAHQHESLKRLVFPNLDRIGGLELSGEDISHSRRIVSRDVFDKWFNSKTIEVWVRLIIHGQRRQINN